MVFAHPVAADLAVPTSFAPVADRPSSGPPANQPAPQQAGGRLTLMGEVSAALAISADLERGRYETAAQQLATTPQSPRFARLRAQLALLQGNYPRALVEARRAMAGGDGASALAACLAVRALQAQGQLDEAHVLAARYLRATLRPGGDDWSGRHASLQLRLLRAQIAAERGQRGVARRDLRLLLRTQVPAQSSAAAAGALADWAGIQGVKAQAAVALGQVEESYELFSVALQAHDDPALMVAWAEAMLLHEHRGLAFRLLTLTLIQNPNYPPALLLRAQMEFRFGADPDAAGEDLLALSQVNPHWAPAWSLRAEMALHAGDYAAAETAWRRALELRPGDLDALSIRAAQYYVQGDDRARADAEQQVLARNPTYVQLFMTEARVAEWLHRYEDQVQLAERALLLDPHYGPALALLGMNLLRIGQEDEGRRVLEQAQARVPHHQRIQRILALYNDVIDQDYVTVAAAPFAIRLSRRTLPVLRPYVGPMLQRAYAEMSSRYGIAPAGPLRVELYDTDRDFAIRTTGLPRVGVQGVCFGSVITAISPRAASYNWGQILWHELSHVFHLQLSKQRVPRWFTEGLAEFETSRARGEWRREEDRTLHRALREGTLPALSELERAFGRASDADDLMVAYYTATLAVSYLMQRVGFEGIVAMLRAWGRGDSSADVLSSVTGDSVPELDRGFSNFLQQRFQALSREFAVEPASVEVIAALVEQRRAEPNNAPLAARLAFALVASGKYEQGAAHAHHALALQAGEPLAHFALSRVALQRGDTREAEAHLLRIVGAGSDSPLLRRMLAHAAKADDRLLDAITHVRAAIALDPDDLAAYRLLVELAVERGDRDLLLAALTAVARLDQHDRMVYRLLMIELAQRKRYHELVRIGEAAIYVDPASATVHRLLAEGYAALGQDAAALQEFEQLQRLHPRPREAELAKFGQAQSLMRMGRIAEAKVVLADVLRLEKRAAERRASEPSLSGVPPDAVLELPAGLGGRPSVRASPD